MSWTLERKERVKKLWADGLSASQIAAELGGVTRNAVIGLVHRLGLSGRAKSPPSAEPRPAYRPSRLLAGAGGDFGFPNGAAAVAAPLPEKPQEEEALVIPFAQRKTLLQLASGHCRWPVGDPGSGDFFFCGGEAIEGRPYCAYHHRVAYQPPSDRRRHHKQFKDFGGRFVERTA